VSRFGLDYALDTMGVVHGGTVDCNYSTYSNGEDVDFVDDFPAVGEIRMREDALRTTLPAPEDFLGQDWSIFGKMDMQAGNVAGDKVLVIGESGVLPTIDITYANDTAVGVFIKDDALVNQFGGNITIGTFTGEHDIEFRFTLSTKRLDIYIDTVLQGGITITSATSLTTDKITFAGHPSLNIQRLDTNFFTASILMGGGFQDEWNFVGRLWPIGDVNAYQYIGATNNTIMVLNCQFPLTSVSPYYDNNPEQIYLTNDNICGGPETGFFLSKGLYMTSNGATLVTAPWNPSYTKTSYTGGDDVIVILGDSNTDADAFPEQTQWPELFAAYCSEWLPDVTIVNIALTGLMLYQATKSDYDRVTPNGTSPSLNLVGRPATYLVHSVDEAMTYNPTIVVMCGSGVDTITSNYTEGPYIAYETEQIFKGTKDYLESKGVQFIATTPIAYESTNPSDAADVNEISAQLNSRLSTLGINFIDLNGTMRQGADYVDSSYMRDGIHLGQAGQEHWEEHGVVPAFDRIFNMR